MRIVAPPGVFKPIVDTWMLAEVLRAHPRVRGGDVLDLCTGSGALAVAAARAGARGVTAVDVSWRAVLAARVNARLNGVSVRALRGDLLDPVAGERFDVIVANPPYVPSPGDATPLPARGLARAWEGGLDGRTLLDRICDEGPSHLRPGGSILLVQSSISGEQGTLARLAAAGLEPRVAARRRGPLGPLMRARADELERRGVLRPGEREEELLVIEGRADQSAPSHTRGTGPRQPPRQAGKPPPTESYP